MGKKLEIDEFDMLLDEQLIKEAELFEEELFADDTFEDYQATDEEVRASYEKLVERLKADGIYREEKNPKNDSEKTVEYKNKTTEIKEETKIEKEKEHKEEPKKENGETSEVNKKNNRIRPVLTKAAGFLVVSGLCIFAASMTSEADRRYIWNNVRILSGNQTRVVQDNDELNELVDMDEYSAITQIENTLDIEMPEFFYRPEGLEYVLYKIDSSTGAAYLFYEFEKNILSLEVGTRDNVRASNIKSFHGSEVDNIVTIHEGIEISIYEVKEEGDILSNYYASWERDDVDYCFSGKISLKEMEKIIENIAY